MISRRPTLNWVEPFSLMTGEVDLPVLDDIELERLMQRSGVRLLGEEE